MMTASRRPGPSAPPLEVLHVVGARPNFMKIAPIMEGMARYPERFRQVLVHTGQHYNRRCHRCSSTTWTSPAPTSTWV